MGMDLSYDYKILNEQEYNRLKNNGLYFTDRYNLNLIDVFDAMPLSIKLNKKGLTG